MRNATGILPFAILPALLAAAPLCAQSTSTFRAQIQNHGSDRGKCTIEVNVDDVADVEISGDMGRLHTLSGQPAQWRRFVCSDPMPLRPAVFDFHGVDGRGSQQLVADPRENRGVAVIHIEDKKAGREGYTFDLEWQGGTDAMSPGARYGDRYERPRGGDNGYYRDSGDRGDNRDQNRPAAVMTCASDDMHRHYCDADTRGGVRLIQQRSGSECRQGATWGYDARGIWVDRGCRADFQLGR